MTSACHVKRRHGVGAVGYAVVQPDQRIPRNDFFEPQRKFRVRFRFVSLIKARFPSKRNARNAIDCVRKVRKKRNKRNKITQAKNIA